MTDDVEAWDGLGADPGWCGRCRHARLNATNRGTTYLRCLRARTEPWFARYPRLPVVECPGFEPGDPTG